MENINIEIMKIKAKIFDIDETRRILINQLNQLALKQYQETNKKEEQK